MALQTVKAYPQQIESGLAQYYHRDVGEWHRGELSSRKLLILLNGMPSDSWFWSTVRYDRERFEEQAKIDEALEVKRRNVSELYASVPKDKWPVERKRKAVR